MPDHEDEDEDTFVPSPELSALLQESLATLDAELGLVPRSEPAFSHWPKLTDEVYDMALLWRRDPREPLFEIGRYQLISQVGHGGFGNVYMARDPELDRRVALKLCPLERVRSETKLLREARALAQLDHPNIISVHDVGRWSFEGRDAIFIVMKYVEGTDLRRYVPDGERPIEQLLDIFASVGEGLVAAHAEDIVHGDVKPKNILVDATTKVPYLVDFGLARFMGADVEVAIRGGTLQFMAPELLLGADRDERSDQYAFCVSLWRCLDGRYPYAGSDTEELLADIRGGEPRVRAGAPMPEAVREVLRVGLQEDPTKRFPSMRALLDALARARGPRLIDGVELEPSGGGEGAEASKPKGSLTIIKGLVVGFLAISLMGNVLALTRSGSKEVASESEPPVEPKKDPIAEARREFRRAARALDEGHAQDAYDAWDDAHSALMGRLPEETGHRTVDLAQRMARIRPAHPMSAWMAAAGARAYEKAAIVELDERVQGVLWLRASAAREVAAKFFDKAGYATDAKDQRDCKKDNEAGQPCVVAAQ